MKTYKSYKGTTARQSMANEYRHYFPMALPRRDGPTWDQVLVAAVALLLMFACLAGFILLG